MANILDADYRQDFLFPPSAENWVPDDHPVRYVREFVDGLDWKRLVGEEKELGETGRPPYAVSLLLKIWLFAYLSRITAARAVERACHELIPMIWLAGGLRPDHNTLWRFWNEHRTLIRRLLRESVRVAMELNLMGFVLHAIDGTKLHAAGSTHRVMNREKLEALLRRVEERIPQLEQEIERAGVDGQGDPSGRLSEQLKDRTRLREAIHKALEDWPEDEVKRHLHEREARLMKGVGLGYNAQIVVDSTANIIVAESVVADQNDEKQLMPMLEKVDEEYGRVAEQTVADGGYNTAEAVGKAEEKGYPVILSNSPHEKDQAEDPYHASQFRYDEERDVVICPQNQELTFERATKRKRQPYPVRIYRGRTCSDCPVRSQCTSDRRGRSIDIDPYRSAVQRQREKTKTTQAKELLRQRMPVAERPFAVIKWILAFSRFRMQSLDRAGLEWSFVCFVHNVKQLMHQTRAARIAIAF